MIICQQKWLTTLSLGLVFSLSSAVSAKAFTDSYRFDPASDGGNTPLSDIAELNGGRITFGYQFSVNPANDPQNDQIIGLGVYASPDDPSNPSNSGNLFMCGDCNRRQDGTGYFVIESGNPNPSSFLFPHIVHAVGLWEVDMDGNALNIDPNTNRPIPERTITINPTIEDPDTPGTFIPNENLAYINGFTYRALQVPLPLSGSEQYFRLGVTSIAGSDEFDPSTVPDLAWFEDGSGGQINLVNADLNMPAGPGANIDPNFKLNNESGNATTVNPITDSQVASQLQGYYGVPDPMFLDPDNPNLTLAFPHETTYEDDFFGTLDNPFFITGNLLFAAFPPLPDNFPPFNPTSTGTGTGTGTGGTPTIPEPSLIHGLLAMAFGGIITRCRQGKVQT